VLVSSRVALIVAGGCAIIAVFVPSSRSGYAVLGAALFAIAATLIPLDRHCAARTLGGIATIGIGVSIRGDAIGFIRQLSDPLLLVALASLGNTSSSFIGAAVAGVGAISLIGVGVAILFRWDTLLGFAGVGFSVSLIGGGIVFQSLLAENSGLPAWLIAAGVIAAIGAGAAFPLVHSKLIGVASIGFGLALMGAGVFSLALARRAGLASVSVGI
jgi:hypothetical protein